PRRLLISGSKVRVLDGPPILQSPVEFRPARNSAAFIVTSATPGRTVENQRVREGLPDSLFATRTSRSPRAPATTVLPRCPATPRLRFAMIPDCEPESLRLT